MVLDAALSDYSITKRTPNFENELELRQKAPEPVSPSSGWYSFYTLYVSSVYPITRNYSPVNAFANSWDN